MNIYKFVGEDPKWIITKDSNFIATGFTRIVHGGRGDYVEFSPEQMHHLRLEVPAKEAWRKDSGVAYYEELRTLGDNVKVYFQKRTVDYADYIVGMYYISPKDLKDFAVEGKR
jgi:hypothetical protein